jgi:hypothetical protein
MRKLQKQPLENPLSFTNWMANKQLINETRVGKFTSFCGYKKR